MLNPAVADALAAAFSAMSPTVTVPGGQVNLGCGGTLTVTGGAGVNVLDLNGNLSFNR